MFKIIRSALLIFAISFCSMSTAQTLWSKAQYGMTIQQVKTAFPGAVAAPKPSLLGTGAQGSLTLPEVAIAGSAFHATFYFVSERLVQVTLALENPARFDSVLNTFNTVEELLRSKYGHEIQREVKRGVLNMASATWMSGATNVSVVAMGVAENNALLNINYQLRVSQEADKL